MLTVDRTNWFDASMGRFHSERVALPADLSLEFKENVKNLVRTYERDDQGNSLAKYVKIGPDLFVLAFIYAVLALPLAAGVATTADITDSVL